ncbi:MAG: methionine ABC transporter substrate-binding protein, partial [Firmicutes bacterium]|nr:methionine ABC transporter substrate-binding protein [Bacillota bacterium]
RTLGEVDLAAINTNYALKADLIPTKDALYIEDKNSPYVNVLVVRATDKDNENLKKLAEALNTSAVKEFIENTYQGAVIPAF